MGHTRLVVVLDHVELGFAEYTYVVFTCERRVRGARCEVRGFQVAPGWGQGGGGVLFYIIRFLKL
jgi:hypothetical protein